MESTNKLCEKYLMQDAIQMQSDISHIKILLHIIENHQVANFPISCFHPHILSWRKMHQIKIQDIWETIQNFAKLRLFKQFREKWCCKKTANAHKKELGWCWALHQNAERGRTLNKSD